MPLGRLHLVTVISLTSVSLCFLLVELLWPPCVADADIIFWPYDFYLFYSSPNLSGRRLDVYHTSTHGVALVRI